MFDKNDISDKNIDLAVKLHMQYSCDISDATHAENILNTKNPYKSDMIKEHQIIQQFLIDYFEARNSSSSQSVITGSDLINRRRLNQYLINEDGSEVKTELVHLGMDYIHEQFNNGNLFPIGTFFTLIANSGIGKSDYLYTIANSFLMQNYKTLIISLEFGEERLSTILDDKEHGGKDKMRDSRIAGKFENLFINFRARNLKELELLIDVANQNGIKSVLIDSFGEIERDNKEYDLQQKITIMLNSKVNDYNMFIMLIAQTRSGEADGEYSARGGGDLLYKPDIVIHIKKLKQEDTSGDRIVHLYKNRDADLNGKTIITEYDFEKRMPKYKCDYEGLLSDGSPVRTNPKFKISKK